MPPSGLQERIDSRSRTVPVETSYDGGGTMLAYTVTYTRDGEPGQGLALVDIGDGHTVARTDPATSSRLVTADMVGAPVTLTASDQGNVARLT